MLGGRISATTATVGAALAGVLLLGDHALVRAAAESRAASLLRLDVLLTISPDLRDPARRTLISEAERIWRHEQVELRWPSPAGGDEPPRAPLRVLVIPRRDTTAAEQRWPVAELVAHEGHRAVAIASIASARRVVDAAARYQLIEHPGQLEYRLGLVLGRAVAHEIGHFLLATGTHASAGLMRATVDAGEFAALSTEPFRLDERARAWMRGQLGDTPAITALRSAGFSYSPAAR
jgi:hypothetical protein